MVVVVELLAHRLRQLRALVGIHLGHRGVDLLLVQSLVQQRERALGVRAALPGQAGLVEGRGAVDPVGLVGLARAVLGQEVGEVLGHALDLDPDLLPVQRHGLHHVVAVERVGEDHRVDAHLEAAAVPGLGQELSGLGRIVGGNLPVLAVALVERVVEVRERRLRAAAPPQPVDDGLLVDRQVQRQAHLARVLLALLVVVVADPRAGRTEVFLVGHGLAAEHDPVEHRFPRLVDAQPGLLRLVEIVPEHLPDVDLTRAQTGQPRRGVGNPAHHQLLERRRLPPVLGHRLEAVVVALPALDVAVGSGADRVQGRLLLAHRLHVLLRRDVLVADELRDLGRHLPQAILEVQHDRVLVGDLDTVEVDAEEGRGAARRVRLEVLLDRELHVLGGHLAEPLVELHALAQLEGPGSHLVRRLPFRGQPRTHSKGLGIARDERVVDAVPEGLLRLARAPGERRLQAPLPDGDHQLVALGGRARGQQRDAQQGHGGGPGGFQKGAAINRARHHMSSVSGVGGSFSARTAFGSWLPPVVVIHAGANREPLRDAGRRRPALGRAPCGSRSSPGAPPRRER